MPSDDFMMDRPDQARDSLELRPEHGASDGPGVTAALAALAALSQLTDGVILTDVDGRITFANDEARRLHALHAVDVLELRADAYAEAYELLTDEGVPFPRAEFPLARAVLRGETVTEVRWSMRRPDGVEVRAVGSARPIRDASGSQVGAMLTIRDDTGPTAAEAALRESDARTRFLADAVPVPVWTATPDGALDYVSAQAAAYVGRPAEEVVGAGWGAVLHADDLARTLERWSIALASGDRYETEFRLWSAAHDQYRWHLVQAVARRDAAGEVVGWVGSTIDIEEHKVIEAAVRDARDAAAREAAENIVLAHRLQEQAVELEHQIEEAQSLAEEAELATQHAHEAAAEAEEARVLAEESEQRFRAIADAAPVLIWTSGIDGGCDWFNQPWLDFTGRTRDEELGDGWAQGVHPDDVDRCVQIYRTAFAARQRFEMDYRLRRHDGAYRWLADTGIPRVDPYGAFVGFIGSCFDVSERKQADEDRLLLSSASAAFVGSLDLEATVERVAEVAVPGLADYCSVDLLTPEGEIRRAASAHVDPDKVQLVLETWRRYPYRVDERVGVPEVLRTGRAQLVAEFPTQLIDQFARDAEHAALLARLDPKSYLCVPLVARDRTLGALSLVYAESGRRYDEHSLQVASELARRIAAAIDTAYRYQAAEADARRSAFLATASARLSASLDIEPTLASIAALAVPALADWCTVDVVDDPASAAVVDSLADPAHDASGDGASPGEADQEAPRAILTRRIAIAHQDPARIALAHRLRERYPPDPHGTSGVPGVLRTGRAAFYPDLSDATLVAMATDGEHLALLRELQLRSAIVVPMLARGRVVGAISLVAAETVAPYTDDDLALAEELGRRAGTALDNARLHQAAVAAQRRAEAAANRTARLQAITSALAESVTADQVADVVLAQGVEVVGASAAVLGLLSPDGATLDLVRATGFSADRLAPFEHLALERDTPLSEAIRTGEPCWLPTRQSYNTRFPEAAAASPRAETQALVAVPLIVNQQPLGAIGLSFDAPRPLSAEEQAFLMAVAAQAAQALDRARLFEAERVAHAAADEARAAAESANAAKSDFLATMSHELRTPINAILGYTELVALGLSGPLTDEQRSQLGRVRGSTQHLLGLVNEILDLARVESGALRVARERASIHHAVDAGLSQVRPQAASKNLTLATVPSATGGSRYVGDEPRVRQILINLLSNAVKFTRPGGRIAVAWSRTSPPPADTTLPDGEYIAVRVADTGVGIPPDQLGRIFEPFTQASSGGRSRYTREAEGTGLGLTISQRLARLMGGALTVQSTVDAGSVFTLWLPVAVDTDAPAAVGDQTKPGDTPRAPSIGLAPSQIEPGVISAGDAAPFAPDEGLARIGAALVAAAPSIIAQWIERLRGDARVPLAADARTADLEDHAATFVTDVGLALRVFATAGNEPAELMRDTTAILALIAERHGAQRARLGWSESAVSRSLVSLGELLGEGVDRVATGERPDTLARARRVVEQLVMQAQRVSLGGYRVAGTGRER